tara:strand:+ start:10125 stop:12122 length:1998 start_codon:yes stop_codon:yes gene_type:complete
MIKKKELLVVSITILLSFINIISVFLFKLDANIVYKVPFRSSNDIFHVGINNSYLKYFYKGLFYDVGFIVPISILLFTILYLFYGNLMKKSVWVFLSLLFCVNLYIRIDTFSKYILLIVCALYLLNIKFEFCKIKINFYSLSFLWIIFIFLQGRISFLSQDNCYPDCRFQGDLTISLIVSFLFILFFKHKRSIKYLFSIFVITFLTTLVFNPLNYDGGLLCCGFSSFEKTDEYLKITNNQWENYGEQFNSFRTGDYKSIESLSLSLDPYEENSQYPPFALATTKFIFHVSKFLNNYPSVFSNIQNLSFLIFLIITFNLFIYFYYQKFKINFFANTLIISLLIILFSVQPSTIAILFLKVFLYLSFFFVNINKFKDNKNNLFYLVPLSFPFIYAVDRGNLDLILFPLVLLCLHFFFDKKYFLSIFFLSISVSLKIFPLLLLLLFFSKNLYKYIFVFISWTACIFIISVQYLSISFSSVFKLISSIINFSSAETFINPLVYSSVNTSFIAFTKQFLSFLNLGYIYGEFNSLDKNDFTDSYGLWTSFQILPLLNLILLTILLYKLIKYLLVNKKITFEFVLLINLIFLIYFPLNFIYRLSAMIALLLFYKFKFYENINSTAILLLLIPSDFFYFPTHLEIVHLGGLIYFPTCLYIFSDLLEKKSNLVN